MSAEACVRTDLGPFSICVPADWTLTRKGIDSVAGQFVSDGLRVSFDFGINSDPLAIPAGSTAIREASEPVGGLAARRVAFTVRGIHFAGVTVQNVRATASGVLKLTLLAQAADAGRLRAAETAFSTVRFTHARKAD